MISRIAQTKILDLASKFKSVVIIGPRQTGKTTIVKILFPQKPYVSLENPSTRTFATEDPQGFLNGYPNGAILDEIQRVPELFSYLQQILDNSPQKGMFILTGSNNLLLQQAITQSLSGRVGYFTLLPFSLTELNQPGMLPNADIDLMLKGFYPPIYDQQIPPQDWCPNYIRTYIERDVRQIKNITDLIVFERFMKILAGRSGQELNLSNLSTEVGVEAKTIQSWIGILEASFIVYLLKPHFNNFNKVLVKRPKIYFYDTALVCSLLGIQNVNQLSSHPLKGAIFEGMVITEFVKQNTNGGLPINQFYWRDKTGHEVDLIIDEAGELTPIEIKSGQTVNSDYFKNLSYWLKLSQMNAGKVLYAGDEQQVRSNGIKVMNWRQYFIQAINS